MILLHLTYIEYMQILLLPHIPTYLHINSVRFRSVPFGGWMEWNATHAHIHAHV